MKLGCHIGKLEVIVGSQFILRFRRFGIRLFRSRYQTVYRHLLSLPDNSNGKVIKFIYLGKFTIIELYLKFGTKHVCPTSEICQENKIKTNTTKVEFSDSISGEQP